MMRKKKYLTNHFALIILVLPCPFIRTHDFLPLKGKSFFAPRSQSVNAARDAVGLHRFINKNNNNGAYGAFFITPEYNRAYKTRRIAEYFFGTDQLHISGSTVATRGANDILADYFGLSTQYQSSVHVCPSVQNALLDFGAYVGWGPFYVRAHAPYVWNKTQIELNEQVTVSGVNTPYPPFYMAQLETKVPAQTFKQAISGGFTWGDVCEGLKFGKISCNSLTESAFSDVTFALGWNFLQRSRGTVGASIRAAAPSGTRSKSVYLLEPVVGSGKHWQLGFGLNTQGLLWEKDGDQRLDIIFDVNIMHLFRSQQKRSFDLLCNGFGSRYILAKEFNTSGIYTGKTQPLINATTLQCDVRVAVQVDFVVLFGYQNKGYSFDIGYNGWVRSAEGIELTQCFKENTYGLKGIANVANNVGKVNDTQSNATLHGNNRAHQGIVEDNPSPILIRTCDIDLRSGAASRQLTHKIVAYGGYTWAHISQRVQPHAGLGFGVEFEGNRPKDVQPNKNSMSTWALWFKLGSGF